MIRHLSPALLGALATLAALYLLGWRPGSDLPHYPRVIADSASVVQGEPSASPGVIDRITRPVSRPEVVATAPGAATGDVAAFCGAAGWSPPGATPPLPETATEETAIPTVSAPAAATPTMPARPHSGIPPALRVQPMPVALARSGRTTHRVTDLWLASSTGDLIRSTHRVRPPVTWRADGDSVIVQGSRTWWVRPLGSLALCAGGGWIGAELGSVAPVVVGCGIGVAVAVR